MPIERRIIAPEELTDFEKEINEGTAYLVKARISHSPAYSGMLTGPFFPDSRFYQIIPVHALKKQFLGKIKIDEEGKLYNAKYEDDRIKFLIINWRSVIQVYYSNPVQIEIKNGKIKTATLEEMFSIIKVKQE